MIYRVKAYLKDKYQYFTIEAPDKKSVPALLFEKIGSNKATLVEIREAKFFNIEKERTFNLKLSRKKVGLRDLELFCKQLSILLRAGITLLQGLTIIKDNTTNIRFKNILDDVIKNVRSGINLSVAISPHKVFNSMFCGIIKTADETGNLDVALEWLAEQLKREIGFKAKIRSILGYPIFLVAFALTVMTGLFRFVVPKFLKLIAVGHQKLPLVTQIALDISNYIGYIFVIFILSVIISIIILKIIKSKFVYLYYRLEEFLTRLPIFGNLIVCLSSSRIYWIMSMLLETGVEQLRMLEIISGSVSFLTLKNDILNARYAVEKGNQMSEKLKNSIWFRRSEVEMLEIGEKSGSLSSMARYASELLDKEIEMVMEKLPRIIEVSTTIFTGVMVLFLLLSIYLPMVSMYKGVAQ